VLVRKMQDLAVSPSMRSLTISGSPTNTSSAGFAGFGNPDDSATASYPSHITGGSNVRRLKALIAQRRRDVPLQPLPTLGVVPEVSNGIDKIMAGMSGTPDAAATFDPFFGDPFE
jgi:hypothetical protein